MHKQANYFLESFLRRSGPESAKGCDVAISVLLVRTTRLPRFARNDDMYQDYSLYKTLMRVPGFLYCALVYPLDQVKECLQPFQLARTDIERDILG